MCKSGAFIVFLISSLLLTKPTNYQILEQLSFPGKRFPSSFMILSPLFMINLKEICGLSFFISLFKDCLVVTMVEADHSKKKIAEAVVNKNTVILQSSTILFDCRHPL